MVVIVVVAVFVGFVVVNIVKNIFLGLWLVDGPSNYTEKYNKIEGKLFF